MRARWIATWAFASGLCLVTGSVPAIALAGPPPAVPDSALEALKGRDVEVVISSSDQPVVGEFAAFDSDTMTVIAGDGSVVVVKRSEITGVKIASKTEQVENPEYPAPDPVFRESIRIRKCDTGTLTLPADTNKGLAATRLVRVPQGIGSAVVISPDGYALTAAHVISGAYDDEIRVVDNDNIEFIAEIVRVDLEQDVALIKIKTTDQLECLTPATSAPVPGIDIFVLGSPASEELSFSVSKGIVSGYRTFEDLAFVQLDASVNPGNSGGPVLNNAGEIVGVTSWKLTSVEGVSTEGISFAVPGHSAIARLGIQFGDTSVANWEPLAAWHPEDQTPEPKEAKAEEAPAEAPAQTEGPAQSTVSQEFEENKRVQKRKKLKGALIGSGAAAMGVGLLGIFIPAGIYWGDDRLTLRGWPPLVGLNTAGWAFSIAGAGLLAAGIAIPAKPKADRKTASIRVSPTGTGVSLEGRF